jgi:hypothetical protein
MSWSTGLQIDLYLYLSISYDVQINKDYVFINTEDLIEILD